MKISKGFLSRSFLLFMVVKPFNDPTEILSDYLYPTIRIAQPAFYQFLSKSWLQNLKIEILKQNLSTKYQGKKFKQCSL